MIQLNIEWSKHFIKTLLWYYYFNKAFKIIKDDFSNLEPDRFRTEGEYIRYSNILKHINDNMKNISYSINVLCNRYKIDPEVFSLKHDSQPSEYCLELTKRFGKTTNGKFLLNNPDELVYQWNEISENIIMLLEKDVIVSPVVDVTNDFLII